MLSGPAFHDPCDAQDPERQDVDVDTLGKQPNAKYTRREMARRRPPCGRTAGSRQRPRCRALAGATEHELWSMETSSLPASSIEGNRC
jgi:hypothetical protein